MCADSSKKNFLQDIVIKGRQTPNLTVFSQLAQKQPIPCKRIDFFLHFVRFDGIHLYNATENS